MAIPFDPVTAEAVGQVFPVADGVALATPSSYLPASVSANGVLLYATGGSGAAQINQLGWYDRSGKLLSLVSAPGAVSNPALSPDEKLVLFSRVNGNGADIWLHDLNRGTESRVTTDSSSNVTPFWSPKGDRIVFASNRTGVYNMYWKAANSDQPEQLLLQNTLTDIPTQWTRDGRFIVYFELDPNTSGTSGCFRSAPARQIGSRSRSCGPSSMSSSASSRPTDIGWLSPRTGPDTAKSMYGSSRPATTNGRFLSQAARRRAGKATARSCTIRQPTER